MELTVVENLGLENGVERKRISLVNPPKRNIMADTHKWYTKDEKKTAKEIHKLSKQR